MTKKASKLINENVIRRWGKLANMPALTENFIDTLEEEEEEVEAEMEMDAEPAGEEPEMEMDAEPEASPEEQEAVENIVQAVVDAIAAETGVDIEVEGDAGGEEMEMEMDAEPAGEEGMEADAEMRDEDPSMRDAYNRTDEEETTDEALELEVIDDEALTEAVLARVVERLLKKN
jgi:hypothetical protein